MSIAAPHSEHAGPVASFASSPQAGHGATTLGSKRGRRDARTVWYAQIDTPTNRGNELGTTNQGFRRKIVIATTSAAPKAMYAIGIIQIREYFITTLPARFP